MITVYHEIQLNKLDSIVNKGLLIGTTGDKRDKLINKTDHFLNKLCPELYKNKGIDRIANIYCYLSKENCVIDIVDGRLKAISEIVSDKKHTLVKLNIDEKRSYVSDLDLYDEVKHALKAGYIRKAEHMAIMYWQAIEQLETYQDDIKRPEVMVTYDVPASCISKAF